MKSILMTLVVCLSASVFAQTETNISIFSKNQKIDQQGIEIYSTNLEMKAHKKIGIGMTTGGLTGGFGLNGEFNLEPQNALVVGLGRGDSYNSFNLAWKHNFESEYLSLYTKVGYGKWFNNNSGANSTTSNDILKRVLTESEVRENKFNTDFFAGGAGLEYNQIEGELAGVNFFGEVLLMTEIKRSVYLPTGSIGITYFY